MRRASILLASAALALAGCASAARILYPVNADALKVRPGDYQIDGAHTTVIFAVDHLGFSTFYGRFNTISGRLSLDVAAPEKSNVAVRIAAASIDTPSDALDEKLRAPDAFDTEKFPDIQFQSQRVVRTGDKTADVEGLLTVKGVTKPVTLKAAFHGSGVMPMLNDRRAGFDATATISRSAFGIDAWKGFVGDEVKLIIAAEFYAAG